MNLAIWVYTTERVPRKESSDFGRHFIVNLILLNLHQEASTCKFRLWLIEYVFWENPDFVFIIIVQFMMSANSQMRFGLQIMFVCLYIMPSHYHHCANLSEDIEPIECLSDIFCQVWVRLSIFSQLSIIQYMGLCVFSLPISLVMIARIYTFSYYHYQIGSMNFYRLFRVRSWNNGMHCMSFYILIHMKIRNTTFLQ